MNILIRTVLAICGLAVIFYVYSRSQELHKHLAREAECHHDGQLDHIPEGSTWRVRFSASEGKLVILGVCKKCGRVTDIEVTESGTYMHLPLAGNPIYDESIQAKGEAIAEDPDNGKARPL